MPAVFEVITCSDWGFHLHFLKSGPDDSEIIQFCAKALLCIE